MRVSRATRARCGRGWAALWGCATWAPCGWTPGGRCGGAMWGGVGAPSGGLWGSAVRGDVWGAYGGGSMRLFWSRWSAEGTLPDHDGALGSTHSSPGGPWGPPRAAGSRRRRLQRSLRGLSSCGEEGRAQKESCRLPCPAARGSRRRADAGAGPAWRLRIVPRSFCPRSEVADPAAPTHRMLTCPR